MTGFPVSPLLSTPLLPLLTLPPPVSSSSFLLLFLKGCVWEATGRGRNTELVWLSPVRKMCLPRFNKFYNCGSHTVGRRHCGPCKPSVCPIFLGGRFTSDCGIFLLGEEESGKKGGTMRGGFFFFFPLVPESICRLKVTCIGFSKLFFFFYV